VRRFDYIVEAIRRAGARKVLFGSDGPWLHPGLELHKIRLLGLPPRQEALVLGGNIARLLRGVRSLPEVRGSLRATALAGCTRPQEPGLRAFEEDRALPPGTQIEHEL